MLKNGEKIILYHGSYLIVENPNLDFCNAYKDFGKGFYLTTDKKQAERFAVIVSRKKGTTTKFVNIYEFTYSNELSLKEFIYPDKEWFRFVCSNRSKKCSKLNPLTKDNDIYIGKIADDNTAIVINNFINGVYGSINNEKTMNFAIKLLKTNKLTNQFCFKNDKSLKHLKFIKAEVIDD